MLSARTRTPDHLLTSGPDRARPSDPARPGRPARPRHPARGLAVALLGTALFTAPRSAVAAPAPDPGAAALMETVQSAFEELDAYEREISMTMNMHMGAQSVAQSMTTTQHAVPPAKHRSEITMMGMTFVNVSNGEKAWSYNPMMKQYTEKDAAALSGTDTMGGMSISETQLSTLAEGATIVGDTTLTLAGDRTVPCKILRVDPTMLPNQEKLTVRSVRLWLSESVPFVLKVVTDVTDVPTQVGPVAATIDNVLTSYTVNGSIADSVFTFTPPAGATSVEDFGLTGGPAAASSLEGTTAPDFTGTTLDGRTVTLSSLRGKVVLVDFWATWCGPCRVELPNVQKLHEANGDALEVLAVSNEKIDTIRSFLAKQRYTFTTIHDPLREISRLYGVTSLPTVVIVDAEGTVTSHLVGLRSEAQLREALAGAGLEEK